MTQDNTDFLFQFDPAAVAAQIREQTATLLPAQKPPALQQQRTTQQSQQPG